MGSLMDWGYTQQEQKEIKSTKCEKSSDDKHDWKTKGSYPSSWGECSHCKMTYYNK